MGNPNDWQAMLDEAGVCRGTPEQARRMVLRPENLPRAKANGRIKQAELKVHRRMRELCELLASDLCAYEAIQSQLLKLPAPNHVGDYPTYDIDNEVSDLDAQARPLKKRIERTAALLTSIGSHASERHGFSGLCVCEGAKDDEHRLYATVDIETLIGGK